MRSATDIGMNRTGIATAPTLGKEMVEGASRATPSSMGTAQELVALRTDYARLAEPIGTMPPRKELEHLRGERATVFVDRLGERLAFERTGARLYEGLIGKLDVFGSWSGGPSREKLQQFHREELAHFDQVRRALENLGADPTAMTPSADLSGVMSTGIVSIVEDPRTDIRQSLEAMLIAELVDHDSWRALVALARGMGQEQLAADFEQALREEAHHLASVRTWVSSGLSEEARVEMEHVPTTTY